MGAARGRLDVSRARGFSRFVGRAEELAMLESTLEHAFAEQGQVIGIVGEAGVGKSRLCHEFAERARARGTRVYQVAGQAHAKSVPLIPVILFMLDFFDFLVRDYATISSELNDGKIMVV